MKASTVFIPQCCNCKNLRHFWLWAVSEMWYLRLTSGAAHRDSSRLSKWRKKTKNKPKNPQNNLKELRAFSTAVCLPVESGTAVHCSGPSTTHEDIISHILPDSPHYWVTGFTEHHKLRLEAVLVWFFILFFHRAKKTHDPEQHLVLNSLSKGKQTMWDWAFLAVIT